MSLTVDLLGTKVHMAALVDWKVSIQALNYLLHHLGITSDWQYRSFCIQISDRYGNTEPNGG